MILTGSRGAQASSVFTTVYIVDFHSALTLPNRYLQNLVWVKIFNVKVINMEMACAPPKTCQILKSIRDASFRMKAGAMLVSKNMFLWDTIKWTTPQELNNPGPTLNSSREANPRCELSHPKSHDSALAPVITQVLFLLCNCFRDIWFTFSINYWIPLRQSQFWLRLKQELVVYRWGASIYIWKMEPTKKVSLGGTKVMSGHRSERSSCRSRRSSCQNERSSCRSERSSRQGERSTFLNSAFYRDFSLLRRRRVRQNSLWRGRYLKTFASHVYLSRI